jgi:excinuclease UvrABC nuclease subunit
LGAGVWNSSDSVLDNVSQPEWVGDPEGFAEVEGEDNSVLISRLEKEMKQAADRLDFERAANIRDRIFNLQNATN